MHTVLKTQREQKHGVLPTLEIPLLHVRDAAHTDVSLILYKHYSTFLIKIQKKLVRRWMKMDLGSPKNNYYWISLGPHSSSSDECTNSLHIITKCTSMEQLKCDTQMWLKTRSRSDPKMNKVVLQTKKTREK